MVRCGAGHLTWKVTCGVRPHVPQTASEHEELHKEREGEREGERESEREREREREGRERERRERGKRERVTEKEREEPETERQRRHCQPAEGYRKQDTHYACSKSSPQHLFHE